METAPIFNGRGATGFVPVVKQSLNNLLAEIMYIIQTDKPNKLKYGGAQEIESLSHFTELKRFVDKAKQEPSLFFENTPDVITTAKQDPKVVATTQTANQYETVTSHNFIMLLASLGALGFLVTQYRSSLF
jgi:hypothetical protein